MVAPLKVGIAGLGTVGAEVVRLIESRAATLAARCGRGVRVVAVTARSKAKKRGLDLRGIDWAKNPLALAGDPGIDCFVELMGGSGEPALSAIEAALRSGKSVVTANKALIAKHGLRLAEARREARRRAEFRGGGRRCDPDRQDPARGACGHRHQSRLRHPQRHLQLHPDPDGAGGVVVRRMPEGRPAARLCRGQSVIRRRRPRHRAEARDPGEPRLRHQGCAERGLCRRHFLDHAGGSARRRRTRLSRQTARGRGAHRQGHRAARASDHGAEIVLDRAGDGRHQCGDDRRRRYSADHTGRPGRGRSGHGFRRGRRHRRCRARHPRQAVRPSGASGCAPSRRRRWSATRAATTSA